jgi:predicted transcriptional regulator of viral defense system
MDVEDGTIHGGVQVAELQEVRVSAGHARLDPAFRRLGKLATRWRLRVNVDVSEFDHREDVL